MSGRALGLMWWSLKQLWWDLFGYPNDGVIRGRDAERIQDEMRNGTPDTPQRIESARRADEAYRRHKPVAPTLSARPEAEEGGGNG